MGSSHTAWLDNEIADCQLAEVCVTKRLHKLPGQIGGDGTEQSFCLPGRSECQPRPPVHVQRSGQRGRHRGRTLSVDARARRCDAGTDPRAARYIGAPLTAKGHQLARDDRWSPASLRLPWLTSRAPIAAVSSRVFTCQASGSLQAGAHRKHGSARLGRV